MAEILCWSRKPRTAVVNLIVIHTNSGGVVPEEPGKAVSLARDLAKPSTVPGYHPVVDAAEAVITAYDGDRVNASGSEGIPANDTNNRGWHLCLWGSADQTSAQWADAYSSKEMKLAASEVLSACRRFEVPVVMLTPDQVAQKVPGICGPSTSLARTESLVGTTIPVPTSPG